MHRFWSSLAVCVNWNATLPLPTRSNVWTMTAPNYTTHQMKPTAADITSSVIRTAYWATTQHSERFSMCRRNNKKSLFKNVTFLQTKTLWHLRTSGLLGSCAVTTGTVHAALSLYRGCLPGCCLQVPKYQSEVSERSTTCSVVMVTWARNEAPRKKVKTALGILALKVWTAIVWLEMGACEHVNMVLNLWVPQNRRNFSTRWKTTHCTSDSPSQGRISGAVLCNKHYMPAYYTHSLSLSLSLSLSVHSKLLQGLVTISFPPKLNQ